MKFKEEVRTRLGEIEGLLHSRSEGEVVRMLKEELKEQKKINQELLDRLMAKSFGELKEYSIVLPESEIEGRDLGPEWDEESAGEVIE